VFYNARPVLNARITTKRTREENHNASRENKKKKAKKDGTMKNIAIGSVNLFK
jgi:ribosome assembly protein YihI (activator of Der GTPase)